MRPSLRDTSERSARRVARVYPAPGIHWVGDGFRVMGYTSAYRELVQALNPFLLIDYHPPYEYAPTTHRRGVGSHPHRGFQTVTLAFEGSVAHHDSLGNGGVIGPGDAQWMSAASGILHQEYHEAEFGRRGGTFHMVQLWVNLPRSHKMAPPSYHTIAADEMGLVSLPEEGGTVRIVAGEYEGVRGPARSVTPISMFDVALNPGGTARFEFSADDNVSVLVMAGEVTINGATRARTHELAVFEHAGETVSIEAGPAARLLLLAGEPIREPIVQYGPFVMTTVAEIEEAIEDFNRGAFGRLD